MELKEMIAACNRHVEQEQVEFLSDILRLVVSEKFGHNINPLPEVLAALQQAIKEECVKEPTDRDMQFYVEVLDALLKCVAKKMLSQSNFDILCLRSLTKKRIVDRMKVQEECRKAIQEVKAM